MNGTSRRPVPSLQIDFRGRSRLPPAVGHLLRASRPSPFRSRARRHRDRPPALRLGVRLVAARQRQAGGNPVLTHLLWTPEGSDLAWTTAIPGLALPLAPVTVLAGPIVAYNLAALLLPTAAAFGGFLLCRQLTHAFWPSFVGGYLFGFSSYMLGQELGHPHLTAAFAVPLTALLLLRYLAGELGGRGLVVRLDRCSRSSSRSGPRCSSRSRSPSPSGLWRLRLCALAAAQTPCAPCTARRLLRRLPSDCEPASLLRAQRLPLRLDHPHGRQRRRSRDLRVSDRSDGGRGHARPALRPVDPACLGGERRVSGAADDPDRRLLPVEPPAAAAGRFLAGCLAVACLATLGAELRVRGVALIPLPWRLVSIFRSSTT